MFGRAPARPDELTFAVDSIDRAALGGKAVRKQVSIKARGLTFHLLLYLPANATAPGAGVRRPGFQPEPEREHRPRHRAGRGVDPEQGDEGD